MLAGGRSARWGGTDKTAAPLAGRPVLAHVLDGVRAAFGADVPVVVVGPPDHPCAGAGGDTAGDTRGDTRGDTGGVRWAHEQPPGGGPVAGLAAGLAALPDDVEVVGVVAGDAPFAAAAVHRLTGALGGGEALVGQDPRGRRQPLLGAYRVAALRRALAGAPAAGRAVHDVLAALAVRTAAVDDREALDLDTPDDLARAAALLRR